MAQPTAGDIGTYVAAAGTVVVSNKNAVLRRVIIPGTFVGSVEFYDSATAAGTAAGNNIYNVGIPALNQYRSIDLNVQTRTGLVYVATGTPALTFTWS